MIPRILHQTWKTADVPEAWRRLQHGWRERHPGWEYRFWTDADLRRLVEEHYPWFLPIYDGYRYPISRVDAARCFILDRHGGVYADLDFECLRPLDELLDGRELVLGLEPKAHLEIPLVRRRGLERVVCNAFLASEPGHPFWEHLFRELVANRNERDPLDAAGPFLLTDAVAAWPEAERLALASEDELYPVTKMEAAEGLLDDPGVRDRIGRRAFAVHHWSGSWVDAYAADAQGHPPAPHEDDFLFFRHFDGQAGCFVDVGANRGQSARSLRAVNRSFEIVSFEPNPELEPALASVKRRLGKGFTHHAFGLGSENARRRLIVPRTRRADLSQGASIEPTEFLKDHVVGRLRGESAASGGDFRLTEVEVEIRRLDDLGLVPDVLKIDTEGWEANVLRGGAATIRQHEPIILLEINNHPPVHRFLDPLGFAPFRYDPESDTMRPWHEEWDALNVFYLHARTQKRLQRALPEVFEPSA